MQLLSSFVYIECFYYDVLDIFCFFVFSLVGVVFGRSWLRIQSSPSITFKTSRVHLFVSVIPTTSKNLTLSSSWCFLLEYENFPDKIHRLDRFPPVTFYFNKSASLTVYPQDYLLQLQVRLVLLF